MAIVTIRENCGLVVDCAFHGLDTAAAVALLHECLRSEREVQACGPCVARMAEHVTTEADIRRPS